jgi:Arc/MetJ family transcription regulator
MDATGCTDEDDLVLDDELLAEAQRLTGVKEKPCSCAKDSAH